MATLDPTEINQSENPYVGPRTYTTAEAHKFFGRDLEARQFIAMIVSNRAMLFYAPSGAGKSSMLNAKVIPGLTSEGFEVLPVGRVSGESGLEVATQNIFVYNLISSLHQGESNQANLSQMSLSHFLDNLVNKEGRYLYDDQYVYDDDAQIKPRVLLIDQFEEILTTNTALWSQREAFFQQLSDALTFDNQFWVVFAMREDFIAGLDPYVNLLPGQLRNHFYMQYLDAQAALEAIKRPPAAVGRPFSEGAAEILVNNLRRIRDEDDVEGEEHLAEFVEPVQLQAVCYQMWEKLKERPGPTITARDVEAFADVDTALINFYEGTIASTVAETGVAEIDLRNWFELELITEAGTRNMVFRGEEVTGELPTTVADRVRSKFIVREVVRPGGIWYELVHDRFVQPVLDANREWRLDQPLIRLAQDWDEAGRVEARLLVGGQLDHFLETNWQALGPLVADYVAASQEARQKQEAALAAAQNAARERELAQQRALASEQQGRADEAEAAKTRLGRWIRVVIAAVVIAVLLAVYATYQSSRASASAQVAEDRRVMAEQAQGTAEAEADRADRNFVAAATNAAVAGEALLAIQEQLMATPGPATPTPELAASPADNPDAPDSIAAAVPEIDQEAPAAADSYASKQYEALLNVQGTATAVAQSVQNLGPEVIKLGESVNGQIISAIRFGYGPKKLLFVGGIHSGKAPNSVAVAETAVKWFGDNLQAIPPELSVYVVTNLNPDGPGSKGDIETRYNANNVDLNRNWDCNWVEDPLILGQRRTAAGGKSAFSEPETLALAQFVRRERPDAVIFWDAAATGGLVAAGGCSQISSEAQALARTFSTASGFNLFRANTSDSEGDASDWLAKEGIPAIFVLMADHSNPQFEANLKGILSLMKQLSG